MKDNKNLFEMVLEDTDEEGLYALSLVDRPAMKSHWLALADKEQPKKVLFKTVDADQHVIMGAVLIPDLPVYREWDGGLYIYFAEETIRKAHELAMKDGMKTFTVMHGTAVPNVHLFETWIVEDSEKDKSAFYGMEQPKGTWMVSLKINNDDVWEDYIKTGDLTGFSIEGLFKMKEQPADTLSEDEFLSTVREALTA